MKWFFNLLIPLNLYAIEPVVIYYPKSIDDIKIVEQSIARTLYLPAGFATYTPVEETCSNRTEGVLTICISKNKETNELDLSILNVDWDFWRRNKNIFVKEMI